MYSRESSAAILKAASSGSSSAYERARSELGVTFWDLVNFGAAMVRDEQTGALRIALQNEAFVKHNAEVLRKAVEHKLGVSKLDAQASDA